MESSLFRLLLLDPSWGNCDFPAIGDLSRISPHSMDIGKEEKSAVRIFGNPNFAASGSTGSSASFIRFSPKRET